MEGEFLLGKISQKVKLQRNFSYYSGHGKEMALLARKSGDNLSRNLSFWTCTPRLRRGQKQAAQYMFMESLGVEGVKMEHYQKGWISVGDEL